MLPEKVRIDEVKASIERLMHSVMRNSHIPLDDETRDLNKFKKNQIFILA